MLKILESFRTYQTTWRTTEDMRKSRPNSEYLDLLDRLEHVPVIARDLLNEFWDDPQRSEMAHQRFYAERCLLPALRLCGLDVRQNKTIDDAWYKKWEHMFRNSRQETAGEINQFRDNIYPEILEAIRRGDYAYSPDKPE